MKKTVLKVITAVSLGCGRIISAAALQSLNINGAFTLWGLPKALSETFAGVAAASNSVSNAATRVVSLYNNLPPKCEVISLSRIQKAIIYILFSIGVVDSLYFAANNFNAIMELRCNLFGETDCEDNFWGANPAWIVLATFGAGSGLICFFAFNLVAIKKNATAFTEYSKDLKSNMLKEKWLLLGVSSIALLSSVSTATILYFSTSKTVNNFFGSSASESWLLKSQVPIAMMVSVIANLFSQVASGKELLKKILEDPLGLPRKWFVEPEGWRKIATYLGLPFFLLDALFSGVGGYAGSQKLLEDIGKLPLVVTRALAVVNAINTGFLYFAFNTRRSLDNAAGASVVNLQKQPLLPDSQWSNRNTLFAPSLSVNQQPALEDSLPRPRINFFNAFS